MNKTSELNNNHIYCMLSDSRGMQEINPKRKCLRFYGVSSTSFENESWNSDSGCEVFKLEIDVYMLKKNNLQSWEYITQHKSDWFDIEFTISNENSEDYLYLLFSEEDPVYLTNLKINIAYKQPTLNLPPQLTSTQIALHVPNASNKAYKSHTFFVGQGMTSIIENDNDGFLIDAGAGFPIEKKDYFDFLHRRASRMLQNDLISSYGSLSKLIVYISHAHEDHWRILDWDANLVSKVTTVFIPAGITSLPFHSTTLRSRVYGVGSHVIQLSLNQKLEAYRSNPLRGSANGNCLIVVYESNKDKALLPGDYVYSRMNTDKDRNIASLQYQNYSAIIVPHHGANSSSNSPFAPSQPKRSRAYFSAGGRYGHPKQISKNSHLSGNWDCWDLIQRHNMTSNQYNIFKYPLL